MRDVSSETPDVTTKSKCYDLTNIPSLLLIYAYIYYTYYYYY